MLYFCFQVPKQLKMKHLIILLLLGLNTYANDSILVYSLSHQIKIEQNWQYVISKTHSLASQQVLDENVQLVIPTNISYKIITDTSYNSSEYNEVFKMIKAFASNYRIKKIMPSDSLLRSINPTNNYAKIIFLMGNGVSGEFKKDLVTLVLDYSFGGLFFLLDNRQNISIQSLVFDNRLKQFTYYENAGRYGEPLDTEFSFKILKSSLEDYFRKGPNLKIK